jgi:hypothetical protein
MLLLRQRRSKMAMIVKILMTQFIIFGITIFFKVELLKWISYKHADIIFYTQFLLLACTLISIIWVRY